MVKVTGAYYVNFTGGPPAVVINYETDIPVSKMDELAAQAKKLMKLFQADIEATGVSAAAFRATHFEGSGIVREGKGYGFVYSKDTDGKWVRDAGK